MQAETLIRHSAELLRIILKSKTLAADNLASEYFRAKKYIGASDRRFISELLFHTLRNLLFAKKLATDANNEFDILGDGINIDNKSEVLIISTLLLSGFMLDIELMPNIFRLTENGQQINDLVRILFHFEGSKFVDIIQFIKKETTKLLVWDNIKLSQINFLPKIEKDRLEAAVSMPILVLEKLNTKLETKSVLDVAETLLSPAPFFIRANESMIHRDDLVTYFMNNGFNCEKSNISPFAVKFNHRAKVTDTEFFQQGYFEIQDEASQLIGFALSPEPGDYVLDACAGAGGKSLLLSQIMKNNGKIISTDTEYQRLKQIRQRAGRASIDIIEAVHIKKKIFDISNSQTVSRFKKKLFDCILIDAPCSGLGTSRRNPLLKFRLTADLLTKFTKSQTEILNDYSRFLAPGGTLVYSTCSILPDENENIIEEFLLKNPDFSPDPLQPVFRKFGIKLDNLDESSSSLTIYPTKKGSDGFFISRMIKND
ncbi:MAG: hypothetical protein NT007_03860 [Candidatus Kapabacteria bacterium]|nr:hypothetical protein [Candidatus Kapabacteria bacterium]